MTLNSSNPTCPYCPFVLKSYAFSKPEKKKEKRIALRAHIKTEHPVGWKKLQAVLKEA